MEQAVLARRAAREAVADVEPRELRGRIDTILADASMAPGVLVVLSARSIDPNLDPTAIEDRAAGVQLIYEGLRLTRTLASEEPWASTVNHTDANIDVLAADVLVSRGFYLLAMTEAADRAVETIRAFGRDQTHRRDAEADRDALDGTLETDVFELAGVAGTTALDAPPDQVRATIEELAAMIEGEPLPAAATLFANGRTRLPTEVADGQVPQSATDP